MTPKSEAERRLMAPEGSAEDADTARLVVLAKAGDRDAFGTLYSRYFDRVFNYLKVAIEDEYEAEDATQQVFTQVLEALHSYEPRPGRPFRAWLFVVVRNHAIAVLKKRGRVEVMDPEELDRRRDRPDGEEEQERALGWITDPDLLLFVKRLPLPQRQALMLRYMLDLPNAQIAKVMGRSQNEVRVLHHRARSFLRERLTAIGREPKFDRDAEMSRVTAKSRVLRERRFSLYN